ncbi:MAG: SLC13 family permease [Anaerolineae bacterium]|nr:SLC13 family permease [Anaerolineae bacterium]
MTLQIWLIFGILVFILTLFVWGRWRYDVVAVLALLLVVFTGLVPIEEAFSGFSNPAVITVAAVLVVSRGLQNSGVVDLIGQWLGKIKGGVSLQLLALAGIITILSAFMNNVGALALLLPVAITMARKKNISPSVYLMPIAFAAHFGGIITLIGTPANLLISNFRTEAVGEPYQIFDFAPVGVGVALVGLLFISFIGWRLIPIRKGSVTTQDLFNVERYFTEIRLGEASRLVDRSLKEVKNIVEVDLVIVAVVRSGRRIISPKPDFKFLADDILIMQIDTENLERLLAGNGIELVGDEPITREDLESKDVVLVEAVITANSMMVKETAYSLDLRRRYGVNLLAISRQGKQLKTRLDRLNFLSGDVILLQCAPNRIKDVMAMLGCLPLAQRDLRIGQPRRTVLAIVIFLTALVLSAMGIVPVQVSFLSTAFLMVITKLISLKQVYSSIDWPIILLLGAMIPVGQALENSGGSQLIANTLLSFSQNVSPGWMVVIIMLMMTLSDVVNNAAAAVLIAPIAINIAQGMGVSPDAFLMAIVLGTSSSFITPIGHQSNTLVMGPGGYKFNDYWRMGIFLEIINIVVGAPLILLFWPF